MGKLYYPEGGWDDIDSRWNTYDEARDYLTKIRLDKIKQQGSEGYWAQIVDVRDGCIMLNETNYNHE